MRSSILVADWRKHLRYAWSVRFMVVAALFSGAEVAIPFLHGLLPVPPGAMAALSAFCTVGAFISKFVAQKEFEDE